MDEDKTDVYFINNYILKKKFLIRLFQGMFDSPKRLAMGNRGLFTNHLAAEHWLTKLLLMSF